LAVWMTFLLGRQAMFGQEPPRYFLSITAARCPCDASVQARNLPASPLPNTTTSNSSRFDMVLSCLGGVAFHAPIQMEAAARRLRPLSK
jgi:hypothetical protein